MGIQIQYNYIKGIDIKSKGIYDTIKMQMSCKFEKRDCMSREYKTRISQAIEAFAAGKKDMGFCVADVSAYLDAKGINANTTTVYRNLDRMVTQDKLIKYQGTDGSSSMYRMGKTDHSCHEHLHMQCMKCGRVIHIDRDTMNHIAKGVQERYGFMIDCDRSSICGICKDCQRRCEAAID